MRWIGLVVLLASMISAQVREGCEKTLALADAAYERFDNKEALKLYTKARKECPGEYQPLWKMTRALNDVGEDANGKEAEEYFVRASKLADTMKQQFPDSVQSYFLKAAAVGNLALLRGGTERVKLARSIEENSRLAIQKDPGYAPSYVILGVYYRKVATIGSTEKALAKLFMGGVPDGTLEDSHRVLEKALELEPSNIFAHLEIAKTLLAMNKAKEARMHLQTVLDLPVTGHQDGQLKRQAAELLKGLSSSQDR